MKSKPDNAAYLALYADLLMENHSLEKALRVMQAAVDIDPAYGEAMVELRKQLGKLDN